MIIAIFNCMANEKFYDQYNKNHQLYATIIYTSAQNTILQEKNVYKNINNV